MTTYSGDFGPLRSRKITEETCKKFNVRQEGPALRFPYYSANRVVGYKEKDPQKNFKWVGKNEDDQLFGQHLFGSGKTIVVTEGELDALSVWQARPNWPVVSVPGGAHSAKKALAKQLPYLMGFNEVVLMFDGDEAGAQAANVVAIGEIGLDYDREQFCPRAVQLKYFDMQLDLAKSLQLPVIFHNRNTQGDFAAVVKRRRADFTTGIVHSFTGSADEMRELCDLGLYIGINGCGLRYRPASPSVPVRTSPCVAGRYARVFLVPIYVCW